MTVLSFPPRQRRSAPDSPAPRAAAGRASGTWCDERAQLRLIASLQRSLVEGLLAAGPEARTVLRAFR